MLARPLEGKITSRTYTDSEGIQKFITEIQIQYVEFLVKKEFIKEEKVPSAEE